MGAEGLRIGDREFEEAQLSHLLDHFSPLGPALHDLGFLSSLFLSWLILVSTPSLTSLICRSSDSSFG